MESFRKEWKDHPLENAGLISRTFLAWVAKVYYADRKEQLNVQNIWGPCSDHKSSSLGSRLEEKWKMRLKKKKKNGIPSLLGAIAAAFWLEIIVIMVNYLICQSSEVLIRPYILGQLIESFTSGIIDITYTLKLTFAMLVFTFTLSLLGNHYLLMSSTLGLKIRAAVVAMVYKKSLGLSMEAMKNVSSGQIVNLVSNDVSRFELVVISMNSLWAAPLQCIVIIGLLYMEIGILGITGMGMVAAVTLLQTYTARLTSRYRRKIAKECDNRIGLTDEILAGINIIKMYAWEKPYIQLLDYARKKELKYVKLANLMRAIYMSFNLSTTRSAMLITIAVYVLSGHSLTAAMIYRMNSYYNILANTLSGMFIRGIAEASECRVSINRLQNYLLQDEVGGDEVDSNLQSGANNNVVSNGETLKNTREVIRLKDVRASWIKNSSTADLGNLSIAIELNKVVGVIGSVGAGKTSLLNFLLGELNLESGSFCIHGNLSYSSQEPWIFGGTVRENILLGLPYDNKRYEQVIQVTSMERDMQLFPEGDMTMVGERGALLSGGQRARINLARAIYKQADIYLLDDPLSAVDTRVAKQIFNRCIKGFLRGKTVLLATHQLQFLNQVDRIIYLHEGEVKGIGTFSELMSQGHDFTRIAAATQLPEDENFDPRASVHSRSTLQKRGSQTISIDSLSIHETIEALADISNVDEEPDVNTTEKYRGNVFTAYLKSAEARLVFSIFVILAVCTQGFATAIDIWQKTWAKELDDQQNQIGNVEHTVLIAGMEIDSKIFYASVQTLLTISLLVFAFGRGLVFVYSSYKCSRNLHSQMVRSAVHAEVAYFNKNPAGAILNRFSKDLGSADEMLPKGLLDTVQSMGQVIGAIIGTMTVNPLLIAPATGFLFITFLLRRFHMKTSLNLKRMENVSRGPVYTHLNTSLLGLTTIRAHGSQKYLEKAMHLHQDLNTSCYHSYLGCQQFYAFSLDIVNVSYLAIVLFVCIFLDTGISGAGVGLAITQTMAVTGFLQWGMRMSSEVSNIMTSVERLLLFIGTTKEEPKEDSYNFPPKGWPGSGNIEFNGLSVRYAPKSPPVLDNVSLKITSGEKIGIVGRTGAGKSSLSVALFRLTPIEGQIMIDGVDTRKISLGPLRSALAIIPQSPVLFTGSLRKNLDPYEEYTDSELWDALEDIEIHKLIKNANGLETQISDGGSNLSLGQRQLVCLARAVVKNRKIIVLDEATASVDPETDSLIQATIRKRFAKCTVLTIAHRLNTIMDSDRILVMDAGHAVEFDTPYNLILAKGLFYNLIRETGPQMSARLIEQAAEVSRTSTIVAT